MRVDASLKVKATVGASVTSKVKATVGASVRLKGRSLGWSHEGYL